MRVLVAAASKHGSTHEIGSVIVAELEALGLDAEYHDIGTVHDLTGYDAVVLGSAMYMGNWLGAARDFATRHAAELGDLPVWLFSSGPLGAETPVPADAGARVTPLAEQLHARDHHVFAGRLDPDDLGFSERLILKVVHAPGGDFRPWDDIAAWARSIGTALGAEP